MEKSKLIRCKAGLASLMVAGSMLLGGCAKDKGFELTVDEERNLIAVEDSYISNDFIEKCYVVEAKSNITGERNIYIARKKFTLSMDHDYDYIDVFTNMTLFHEEGKNTSIDPIKETPLFDCLVSLNLVKGSYSYEDMHRILEEIKAVYEFEFEKDLVK